MRRLIVGLIALTLAAVPALAKKEDPWLNGLCFVACGTIFLDTALTYDWLQRGGKESNPFWREKLNHPGLVLTIDIGACLGIIGSSRALRKIEGPWAYIIPVAVIFVQGFYLYEHYRVRH